MAAAAPPQGAVPPQAPAAAAAEASQPQGLVVLQNGQVVAGHEIIKPLGKGKFSIVYMAKRLSDGLFCALKKINIFDMMQPKQREKCLKEVRILQSLDHPNIVRLLEAIVEQSELLIIVDWAEKGDLKRLIRKAQANETRFKEPQIWEYSRQLAGALEHMHGQRVMHRDIKPANIFMASDGSLKLGDLGLGRLMSSETLEAFSKVGTPLYMSPEVLHGAGYDMKSDVWSLGCVIYELAMLKSPFKSEQQLSLYDLFVRISKGQYPPLADTCSAEFKKLVDSTLLLKAAERPDSATVCQACVAQLANLAATNTGKSRKEAKRVAEVSGSAAPSPEEQPRVLCRPSPLLVMDDIVEKLKLLDCEERLLRPRGYPILHRCFFTQRLTLPGELTQFEVMYELCRWLLSLMRCREEHAPQPEPPSAVPGGALAADASAGPPAQPAISAPRKPHVAPAARRPQAAGPPPSSGAGMGAGDAAAGGCFGAAAGKAAGGAPSVGGGRAAVAPRVHAEDVPDLTENLLVELRDRGIPVTSHSTIKQLQQGFGEGVCLILNELINQELLGRDFHFEGPLWNDMGGVDEEAPDEVEEELDGAGALSAGSECGDEAEAIDPDAERDEERSGSQGRSPSAHDEARPRLEPVHIAEVDVAAWRAEFERVRPHLTCVARASDAFGGWRSTLATTVGWCREVVQLNPSTKLVEDMRRQGEVWRDELERVQQREDQLNAKFADSASELARLRGGSAEAAERLGALHASVTRLTDELTSVEQELDKAKVETSSQSEALNDLAEVTRLKTSVRRLKDEERQLALRTAVVQNELAGHSLRRAPAGSSAAAAGAQTAYRDRSSRGDGSDDGGRAAPS